MLCGGPRGASCPGRRTGSPAAAAEVPSPWRCRHRVWRVRVRVRISPRHGTTLVWLVDWGSQLTWLKETPATSYLKPCRLSRAHTHCLWGIPAFPRSHCSPSASSSTSSHRTTVRRGRVSDLYRGRDVAQLYPCAQPAHVLVMCSCVAVRVILFRLTHHRAEVLSLCGGRVAGRLPGLVDLEAVSLRLHLGA